MFANAVPVYEDNDLIGTDETTGDGEWVPIGTDDNAPYRIFYDAGHLRSQEDTPLSFRAIVNDLSGHLAADQVLNVGGEFAEPTGPETPYVLIHYNRSSATTA